MSMLYAGLPLAWSAPFILAIWAAAARRPRACSVPQTKAGNGSETVEPSGLDWVLRQAAAEAAARCRSASGHIELALGNIDPGCINPGALQNAMREVMVSAVDASSSGRVLVTAAARGNQMQIRVTDDGAGSDHAGRTASLCQAAALLALQDGSMTVEVRPDRGTTVTIRLPAQANELDPAEAWPGDREPPVAGASLCPGSIRVHTQGAALEEASYAGRKAALS